MSETMTVRHDSLQIWQGRGLLAAGVRHGFSMRAGGTSTAYLRGGGADERGEAERAGELNCGYTAEDAPERVLANRRLLLERVFGQELPLATLRQVHSAVLHRVGLEQAGDKAMLEGDGLMTDEPGVTLGIQTADCVPVLVADPRRGVVAAFHAGWRGTVGRIVEQGIGRMRLEYGCRPEDLVAAIGPAIGACCYEVGAEVERQFRLQFGYAESLFQSAAGAGRAPEELKARLDLPEANRRQLLAAGLRPEAIDLSEDCTQCRTDRYFSYRGEKGRTGRMLAVIGRA